jgi:hypothetical protein
MALFRNLGVNLRDRLCDVPMYVSAQSLDFLDLAKNYSFLNWKLTSVPRVLKFIYGWALIKWQRVYQDTMLSIKLQQVIHIIDIK